MIETYQLASTASQLLAQARTQTGIDIVDADIAEKLEKFVHALNTEADLHQAGARAMEWHLLLILTNRLRMLRDFNNHPEIAEQQILPPVILGGMARTGSTKLHKLLAATGDFHYLPCWQGISLSRLSDDRNENTAPRIRIATEHIDWFNAHAPMAKRIHEFSPFEAEEENLLLAHTLFAQYMLAFALTPSYLQWYVANTNFRADFEFMKQTMRYLQWQFHAGVAKPWVMKNPTYPGLEPILAQVFPGASFSCTHREPVSTMSSSLSLLHHYHVAYSNADRRLMLGQMMVEGLAMGREQQIAARDAHPEIKVLDIPYSQTISNAVKMVEALYDHAGMSMSAQARQAVLDWERDNTQHKLGAHQHTLDEYGTRADQVRQRFSAYINRFGNCF